MLFRHARIPALPEAGGGWGSKFRGSCRERLWLAVRIARKGLRSSTWRVLRLSTLYAFPKRSRRISRRDRVDALASARMEEKSGNRFERFYSAEAAPDHGQTRRVNSISRRTTRASNSVRKERRTAAKQAPILLRLADGPRFRQLQVSRFALRCDSAGVISL